MLVKEDARCTRKWGVAVGFSLCIEPERLLYTPVLRSTMPSMFDDLGGWFSTSSLCPYKKFLGTGLHNVESAEKQWRNFCLEVYMFPIWFCVVSALWSSTISYSSYEVHVSTMFEVTKLLWWIYATRKSAWISSLNAWLTWRREILRLLRGLPLDTHMSQLLTQWSWLASDYTFLMPATPRWLQ